MSQPFGFETFFEISKFCSSVFLIFEFGKETCSKVFCALIYFVWFPTIPFASWDRGDQSDVLYTISSRSFSLMYSARVLVLPPRHDNLWRSVNIDIQLAGLWHEREPCLHFNSLWSDYALTLGQLSTVPKKKICIWLDHNWSSSFFPNSCFQRSHRYSVEESEGRDDLAADTNDAVDDIVDGLITFGPNFWTDNPRSDIFRPQSTDKSGL